ncbi:MAG: helix-hairpin-helix domain-containing protein, partial [Chitinophagaceae bacterium]|nr:helix-hairpin-helix domain-containing protein [Chitinophagaceae bacterium]
ETREWQSKLAAWKGKKKEDKLAIKELSVRDEATAVIDSKETKPVPDIPAYPEKKSFILFPFDPNLISAGDWKKLGIPDRVIRTITNYLNKGGRFRKPEDISRIYGMHEEDVKRLLPYARIPGHPKPVYKGKENIFRATDNPPFPGRELTTPAIRKKKYSYLDVNTADTSAWMEFPGIGSRLAFRIVQFREKLGGFYSADQVGETYALPDSTFQKIRPWLNCQGPVLRKIRINIAEVEELRQHPYLRWNLANAIVQYRKQHGPFHSATDLQKIILMDPLSITKIAPYLEY